MDFVAPHPESFNPRVLSNYANQEFKELPHTIREAAETLGYTETTWNSGLVSPYLRREWDDLTDELQVAAKKLGYQKEKWNKIQVNPEPVQM